MLSLVQLAIEKRADLQAEFIADSGGFVKIGKTRTAVLFLSAPKNNSEKLFLQLTCLLQKRS